jgi:hypothetical protein
MTVFLPEPLMPLMITSWRSSPRWPLRETEWPALLFNFRAVTAILVKAMLAANR